MSESFDAVTSGVLRGNAQITSANAAEVISRYMSRDRLPIVVDLDKSRGSHLYDAQRQRRILDCFSFTASNPVGFNHPKMFDLLFEQKLLRAARVKPSNSDVYTVEMAEFVDLFGRLAMPAPFRYLFLVEGGAQGVENALKAAFDWKVRRNFQRGMSREAGSKILHFQEAFHGRSGYALSLTNSADQRKTMYYPKFDWPRIPNPKVRFPLNEEHLAQVREAEEQSLALMRGVLEREQDDIAAIILEPIQAEGGDNHFRPEFHRALQALAGEFSVLLIYDEVQTGIGLTGKMWAYEHFGVTPDLIAFGKKAQVCGVMGGPRLDEVEHHVFLESGRINSTWGGNLVDMVRAEQYLRIIDEERLVDRAARVGEVLLARLEALEERYPDVITNARGRGLMCAFDLPSAELRHLFLDKAFEFGAAILPCGKTSVRFRPSLTFSEDDVAELMNVLGQSVEAVRPGNR